MARILTKFVLLLGLAFALAGYSQNGPGGEKTILAMGDSLMAGYNLPPGVSFPSRLEAWLTERGVAVEVINAGVSADTSSGGLARLEWTLAGLPGGKPDLVILEFGANDMLRGIDPAVTRRNLDAMLKTLSGRGIETLVMGMKAAPNLGPRYAEDFNAIFPELAEKYDVALYPFFLEGVAADPELNLDDGVHPNEKGLEVMVERAGPKVLELLQN